MNVLGIGLSGNIIIEVDVEDKKALTNAGKLLLSLGAAGGELGGTVAMGYVQPPQLAPVEKVKRHYKKRATKAEVLDTNRDKACKICGKKFHDNSPRNTMVTYEKASCQLQHKREYQRAWYDKHRKVGKKTAAAAPAPAAKPDRIAMLKSINTRISDRGPIDEVTALAGRLASEEGRG